MIQIIQVERPDHFLVLAEKHFNCLVGEYLCYYHPCRPHQGIGNRLIGVEEYDESPTVVSIDDVQCEERLGGLLKHYYRAAWAVLLLNRMSRCCDGSVRWVRGLGIAWREFGGFVVLSAAFFPPIGRKTPAGD